MRQTISWLHNGRTIDASIERELNFINTEDQLKQRVGLIIEAKSLFWIASCVNWHEQNFASNPLTGKQEAPRTLYLANEFLRLRLCRDLSIFIPSSIQAFHLHRKLYSSVCLWWELQLLKWCSGDSSIHIFKMICGNNVGINWE